MFRKLTEAGLRCELDDRNEKIGYKIREAQLEKVPYMLVIGEKEAESGAVSVRSRKEGDMGAKSLDDFLASILKEVADKARISIVWVILGSAPNPGGYEPLQLSRTNKQK